MPDIVAIDEPEMAPKIPDATTSVAPNPPLTRPTREFAKLTIPSDIPVEDIKPPAKIKKGIAIIVKELRLVKMQGTTKSKPIPVTVMIIMAAVAKQAKRGNPNMRSTIATATAIPTIII